MPLVPWVKRLSLQGKAPFQLMLLSDMHTWALYTTCVGHVVMCLKDISLSTAPVVPQMSWFNRELSDQDEQKRFKDEGLGGFMSLPLACGWGVQQQPSLGLYKQNKKTGGLEEKHWQQFDCGSYFTYIYVCIPFCQLVTHVKYYCSGVCKSLHFMAYFWIYPHIWGKYKCIFYHKALTQAVEACQELDKWSQLC